MLEYLLQAIYPSTCAACHTLVTKDSVFCPICFTKLKRVVSLHLPVNKAYTLAVHAAAAYEEPIRPLILRKFSEDLNACRQLGSCMLDLMSPEHLQADYIVPIPLHWRRYAYRGFNQAHEIARVIGKKYNIPVLRFLARKRHTIFQSRLSKKERQENVSHVFDTHLFYKIRNTNILENKRVLIIDDLCTTGETLKNAAKIIAQYKPASIGAAVACRKI